MKYKKILDNISSKYQSILGNNLVGVYVHGSLAFGCFNPNKSDIDFIKRTRWIMGNRKSPEEIYNFII